MKSIFTILLFILTCNCLNSKTTSCLECESYYDSILNKNIYKTVQIYPSYKEGGITSFISDVYDQLMIEEQTMSKLNVVHNSRVVIQLIISEKGIIEDFKIHNKEIEEYSYLDQEFLKAIKKISASGWNPGICNDKKVSTIIYIPFIIRFRD